MVNKINSATDKSTTPIKEYKIFDFENKIHSSIKNNHFKDITLFPNLPKKRESKTISSYVNLTNYGGSAFKSEKFKLVENSWQLLFIPNHRLPKSSKEFLSIYLISNDSKDLKNDLKVDFSIELYNYKKATSYLKSGSFEFTSNKTYSGFNEFIAQEEIDIDQYYRPDSPAYYFSLILTIDKVVEQVNRNSISSVLKQYQDVNQSLKSISTNLARASYYRSLVISLYFIPIFREGILRISSPDIRRLYYQIQRLFICFAQNKEVQDIYMYNSAEYFLFSNLLHKYEYPKIIDNVISDSILNSTKLKEQFPLNSSQLKNLSKFDYKEVLYDPSIFSPHNKLLIPSLGPENLDGRYSSFKTNIDSTFMKSIESNYKSGTFYINIPLGLGCLDSNSFSNKLLESNSKITKDSITDILFVSFLNRSLAIDSKCQESVSIYNEFQTFRFPDEFTIFKDKVYSLYSVWSYDKRELTPDYKQDSTGTQVTYLYDFNNKVWIKITPNSVEEVSFKYVVENSSGLNNDRIINNSITRDLKRDLTFSYMLVYVLKDKVKEFFNYKTELPLNYSNFEKEDKILFQTARDQYPIRGTAVCLNFPSEQEQEQEIQQEQQKQHSTQQISSIQLEDIQEQMKDMQFLINSNIEEIKNHQEILMQEQTNNIIIQQQQQQDKLLTDYEMFKKVFVQLHNDNKELEEKCKSLQFINQEKEYIESQLRNQINKVDTLEKQIQFVDNIAKKQIISISQKWQDESKRYFEQLQKSSEQYNLLFKKYQDNNLQRNQLNEENNKLTEMNKLLNEELKHTKQQLSNTQSTAKNNMVSKISSIPHTHLIFDHLKQQLNITESQLRQYDYSQILELEKEVNKLSERIRKDLKNKNKCIICEENKKEIAFIPCGHHSTCEKCSVITNCPLCRVKIIQKIKIIQ